MCERLAMQWFLFMGCFCLSLYAMERQEAPVLKSQNEENFWLSVMTEAALCGEIEVLRHVLEQNGGIAIDDSGPGISQEFLSSLMQKCSMLNTESAAASRDFLLSFLVNEKKTGDGDLPQVKVEQVDHALQLRKLLAVNQDEPILDAVKRKGEDRKRLLAYEIIHAAREGNQDKAIALAHLYNLADDNASQEIIAALFILACKGDRKKLMQWLIGREFRNGKSTIILQSLIYAVRYCTPEMISLIVTGELFRLTDGKQPIFLTTGQLVRIAQCSVVLLETIEQKKPALFDVLWSFFGSREELCAEDTLLPVLRFLFKRSEAKKNDTMFDYLAHRFPTLKKSENGSVPPLTNDQRLALALLEFYGAAIDGDENAVLLGMADVSSMIIEAAFCKALELGRNSVAALLSNNMTLSPFVNVQRAYVLAEGQQWKKLDSILLSPVTAYMVKVEYNECLRKKIHEEYELGSQWLGLSKNGLHELLEAAPSMEVGDLLINKELFLASNASFPDVKILSFADSKISSRTFEVFTEAMPPEIVFQNVEFLNLQDTSIDEKVAGSLARWLQLENLKYVSVTGTYVQLDFVDHLYKKLTDKVENIREAMLKIIFIAQDFIQFALNHRAPYDALVKKGIISKDWPDIHNDFYTSDNWKKFVLFRYKERYKAFAGSILKPSKEPYNQGSMHDDFVESPIELSFEDALQLTFPKPPIVES